MNKTVLFTIHFFCCFLIGWGQLPENNKLFLQLKTQDSLLFDRAFNRCETEWLNELIATNFEFYHDQSGITPSKEDFLKIMREGICRPDNPYTSRRELIENSLKVYPLYNNGDLYGAVQQGEHRFYEKGPDGIEKEGSTALFTHLWILSNQEWKLERVLSYNHHKN